MLKAGFIGSRGMVGSVLLKRMTEENDFSGIESFFFSTSQAGNEVPKFQGQSRAIALGDSKLLDAGNILLLSAMDVIVTCQGSDYSKQVFPKLMQTGWKGFWIDAASWLRANDGAVIVLDPVNRNVIDKALARGNRIFVGGNCTVSLMLMALAGLFKMGWVEWISTMTYQAASGAGAQTMLELVRQIRAIGKSVESVIDDPAISILEIDRMVQETLDSAGLPVSCTEVQLASSLIPWIDSPMPTGQTREEWKGYIETNRILDSRSNPIPVDGQCVRVGSMRCHSQGLTIKLVKDIPLYEIEAAITAAHPWAKVIPNNKADTIKRLTPAAVAGTLDVPIGRMRKMNFGPEYLTAFTVGDQLLWGAAEPVRRMFNIVREFKNKG
jgi:aspartate-semialdehyde dehydrogenase